MHDRCCKLYPQARLSFKRNEPYPKAPGSSNEGSVGVVEIIAHRISQKRARNASDQVVCGPVLGSSGVKNFQNFPVPRLVKAQVIVRANMYFQPTSRDDLGGCLHTRSREHAAES